MAFGQPRCCSPPCSPRRSHFSFLIFAPIFWGISWLFGAHLTNRARAAHLTHGSRPPKHRHSRATARQPLKNGPAACPSDLQVFSRSTRRSGHVRRPAQPETTLHAITMQLKFWRPLYYTAAFGLFLGALIQFAPPLFASVTGPLPELLLWIANNFDWSAVHEGCPALNASPTPPIPLPWS